MDEADFLDDDAFLDEPGFSVYSAPVILPLVTLLLTVMYAGYVIDKPSPQGPFDYLKAMSLGIFLLNQTGQLLTCLYAKWQLDGFLKRHPVIQSQEELEMLKPLIRTNMYFVPSVFLYFGLAIPTGLICLSQKEPVQVGIVIVTWIVTSLAGVWCSASEKKIRSLECANPQLKRALERLSESWVNRAFPDF